MTENQDGRPMPNEVGIRLKLANGRVTEAEHVVVHTLRETSLANLETPRLPLVSPVTDEAYRNGRNRLLAIGASYYDALDNNNGSLAPFADDCVRFENGLQTARNAVTRDPSTGWD